MRQLVDGRSATSHFIFAPVLYNDTPMSTVTLPCLSGRTPSSYVSTDLTSFWFQCASATGYTRSEYRMTCAFVRLYRFLCSSMMSAVAPVSSKYPRTRDTLLRPVTRQYVTHCAHTDPLQRLFFRPFSWSLSCVCCACCRETWIRYVSCSHLMRRKKSYMRVPKRCQ